MTKIAQVLGSPVYICVGAIKSPPPVMVLGYMVELVPISKFKVQVLNFSIIIITQKIIMRSYIYEAKKIIMEGKWSKGQ